MVNPLKALRKKTRKSDPALISAMQQMSLQLAQIAAKLDERQRETYLLYNSLAVPPAELWRGLPVMVEGAPATSAFPKAAACRQDSFDAPYFAYWTRRLHEGLRYHRKLWEFVFICQALWERGAIKPGAKGLGFGVGGEPLSAFFASEGCKILATDMDFDQAEEMGWTATQQHAVGKDALRRAHICPDDVFTKNVEFRTCDMNHVPEDLTGFDFCWSACALEHLGSIELGLAFIERSVECLKPGGWAVHTTELNTSSNDDTIDNMGTVLFRRRDFEALAQRLRDKGHWVAPMDFSLGDHPVDRYIDVPPYREQPHLQLALIGYSATSFGLIIKRGA